MIERLTLNGIKSRGEGKKFRAFLTRKVRIWSTEHAAWWRPDYKGYTRKEDEAGIYNFCDAYAATKHCGREKRISYYPVN